MGKLYADMDREDWLRAKRIAPEHVPRTLVMVGEDWNPAERMADLEAELDVVVARPRWNVVVGDIGGKRVGLANVMWAPMAAVIAHQFFSMGTEAIIVVGFCGGLHRDVGYGGVLVADRAVGEDGASLAYGGGGELAADADLVARAAALCRERRLVHTQGRVVTTDVMLLEDRAMIERWCDAGHRGVDGETAAVYAVAKRMQRRALALLTCSDSLLDAHSLYEMSEENERASDDAVDACLEIALSLA